MQNEEFPVQRLADGAIDYALYRAAAARLTQQARQRFGGESAAGARGGRALTFRPGDFAARLGGSEDEPIARLHFPMSKSSPGA